MSSVNKVILIGRVGRDPEMRYMPSGDAIANIAVATSFKSKDRNTGESKETTEWHRVAYFGKVAEIVGQHITKGSMIYVEGRLETRKYTDKDGVEKYATQIVGDQMRMLGGGQQQDGGQQPQARPAPTAPRPAPAPQPQARPAPNFSDMDSDIPF